MLRFALGLAPALSALGGCVLLDGAPGTRSLKGVNGVPIKTPEAMQINPASMKSAERVQELGQRIIEQNTFTGLAPLFHTVSVKEPILFHRGPDELFISDGVINRCKSESQLAAVLCVELGRMMAEKRAAKSLGVELTSVREIESDIPVLEGTIASATEPAKKLPIKGEKQDPEKLSRDLMFGAGFDPAAVAEASDLLRGVKRSDSFMKKIAGPAPPPRWQQ